MSKSVKPWRVGWILLAAAGLGSALGIGSALIGIRREESQAAARRLAVNAKLPAVPASTPLSAAPRHIEGLPPYPNAQPHMLIDQPHDEGAGLNAQWFTTDDGIEAVLSFYAQALQAQKRVVLSHRFGRASGYVGYFEDESLKTLKLVSAMTQSGQTLVMLSQSTPEGLVNSNAANESGLPMPPGAGRAVRISTEGAKAVSLYVSCPSASLDRVLTFYRQALPRAGWRLDEASGDGLFGRVSASKGAHRASVSIEQRPNETAGISIIILERA